MERELEALKNRFCKGEDAALWEMVHLLYPELVICTSLEDLPEGFENIRSAIDKILKNRNLLCNSKKDIIAIWTDLLLDDFGNTSSKKTNRFFEDFMNPEGNVQTIDSSKKTEKIVKIPSPLNYIFHTSLNEIEQIIYERIYIQKWVNHSGIKTMQFHLINVLPFGNFRLKKLLKKTFIYQPYFTSWFSKKLANIYINTNLPIDSWAEVETETKKYFTSKPKQEFENIAKRVNIYKSIFEEEKTVFKQKKWTELEQFFFIIHKYMKVENLIEIWHLMNIFALDYQPLEKELKEKELLNKGKIFEHHKNLRNRAICKLYKIGITDKDFIKTEMQAIASITKHKYKVEKLKINWVVEELEESKKGKKL